MTPCIYLCVSANWDLQFVFCPPFSYRYKKSYLLFWSAFYLLDMVVVSMLLPCRIRNQNSVFIFSFSALPPDFPLLFLLFLPTLLLVSILERDFWLNLNFSGYWWSWLLFHLFTGQLSLFLAKFMFLRKVFTEWSGFS